ncbi:MULTISPECIES: ATPase, T2SS/T4P/T4SS family [Acidithiobacillus]|jgi:Flp pilus assembly CpaF family ATPase|uniref:ATPase, T2SS/T4P/T4SS family n=1 Tax=Acidithiobacillus TaxID=119977 RepID=UPI001C072E8C|nr:ATPase, T2SS/T4P/T4SS family [Acidithiobacillus ferrooxidans]MBU2809772.1 Flp pilus assembly complex ATPase component TadA [Acidithiobacillus ferrooxidans F221]
MALDPKVEAHQRLVEQLRRSFGQTIMTAFDDEKVVEIMANPDGKLLVERHGQGIVQEGMIAPQQVQNIIGLVAAWRGTISNAEKPICEGSLPREFGGARFEGILPPLSKGPLFAIRLPARSIYTLTNYVEAGILSNEHGKVTEVVVEEKKLDMFGTLRRAIELRKNILVSGGTGCFGAGHPVLMFDGTAKPVETVCVGDEVMGPDGTRRLVKDVHCGLDHMVRVIPCSGEPFVVNQWHNLALVETHRVTRKKSKMSVLEWTRASEKFKHIHKLYYTSAVSCWKEQYLPIDPYFMGVLLGDGSFMDSVSVTKPDDEIWLAVNDAARQFGLHVHTYYRSANNPTHKLLGKRAGRGHSGNGLIDVLKSFGLHKKRGSQKFIPDVYKRASLEHRLSLLGGLMDTDGHLAKANSRRHDQVTEHYDYISVSQTLAEDIVFVAKSCGLYASVHPARKSCAYADGSVFTGDYYRVYVGGNIGCINTRIPRKQAGASGRDMITSGIKEIQSLGQGAYYGFEVDHPDHLFVDGHFMVQGNSGKTTLLNAILQHISVISDLDQRIVTIEDTNELQCSAPNFVDLLTDDTANVDMTRLLKATMRLRPDRIVVGEVRDGSALALLKAWNTGHPGGAATVHANNPQAALLRLDQLCQEAGVPSQSELIAEAVDIVIQIQRDKSHPAGRRITSMWDVKKQGEIA